MKVFILLSVAVVALASRECGENAHYESCGTACPLTCENYQNPPKVCVLMCKSGCFCDKGYVKTLDGSCVRPEQCSSESDVLTPRECGVNERFSTCGTACPLTCDNYDNPPKICPLMCLIGCECEPGFVKTRDGRCVRPEECPNRQAAEVKNCLDKPDPGMCRAYMPMWYYDVNTEKCHEFIYGGCHGNGNRFATEEECLSHCDGVYNEAPVSRCELPVETGPCRARIGRYYFDNDTNQCRRFVYGGCGGNLNNFVSLEDCQQACA